MTHIVTTSTTRNTYLVATFSKKILSILTCHKFFIMIIKKKEFSNNINELVVTKYNILSFNLNSNNFLYY